MSSEDYDFYGDNLLFSTAEEVEAAIRKDQNKPTNVYCIGEERKKRSTTVNEDAITKLVAS